METSTDDPLRALPEFRSGTPEKNFRSAKRPQKPKQETTNSTPKESSTSAALETSDGDEITGRVAEVYRIMHDLNETLASSD